MTKAKFALTKKEEIAIAGRKEVEFRLAHPHGQSMRPTITLSREFGCAAFPLAEQLKEQFQAATGEPWVIQDRKLMREVSETEGLSIFQLRNLGDPSADLDALGLFPSGHVTHEVAFEKLSEHLIPIAQKGNTIIIGFGGSLLCNDLPNCFHFRLHARLEWRVARVQELTGKRIEEALDLVTKNAKHREQFISKHAGGDIDDPRYYDAIFNNERHTEADIAAAILSYARSSWPDQTYFKS